MLVIELRLVMVIEKEEKRKREVMGWLDAGAYQAQLLRLRLKS